MKLQPLTVIFAGLFLTSFGFNISQHQSIKRLVYQVQKLEAGPAKGLFLQPEIPKPSISDEELNELMKRILKKMIKERTV
jgi:hypothetical protein